MRQFRLWLLLLGVLSFTAYGQTKDQAERRRIGKAVFRKAKWGVFVHYLADSPGATTLTPDSWNRRINAFNVNVLANQLVSAGASYFFITVGQNSGFFNAPNPTYDALVGHQPSHCSQRDLITDLAKALATKGIKLGVYLPANAPENDKQAVERLGWMRGDHRNAEFQTRWEAIIQDWSKRWGKNVFAWWIDGAFFADAMYRHKEVPNFQSFAASLRAGNPNALIAFNPGVNPVLKPMTEHEDFTAGEVDFYLPLPGKQAWNHNNPVNTGEALKGEQLHYFSFLGDWWGKGTPRFPNDLVKAYTRYVNSQGGAMTWDVPISIEGRIPDSYIKQLKTMAGMK